MIIVNIARVTPDNLYLEFNVETDSNYVFKHLYLWSSTSETIFVDGTEDLDLSDYLDQLNNKEIKRIPLSNLVIDKDLVYYLQFVVEWDTTGTQITDDLFSNVSVVNLSYIYTKKLELTKFIDNKDSIYRDNLMKLYILENCLTLATSLQRYEDANVYVALIKKIINT